MREVAVVGVGMTKFGRFPEKSVSELGGDAILDALKDCGMSMKDIQVAYSAGGGPTMRGQEILREVGTTGIPMMNIENACASGSSAFREAYLAVASGHFDVGLAVGTEKLGKAGLLGVGAQAREQDPEGIIGTFVMPGIFAQLGVRHMADYGTTAEQFATVAVKNHRYSVWNPRSHYRTAYTLEEVLNARMVAWPNTLYMCCPTTDGGAAAILCSMDKARQFTSKPVRIASSVLATPSYSPQGMGFVDVREMTRRAADLAYGQAGVGPEDLDMVELHDCFATAELLHYENLHLCEWGEGGKMVQDGAFDLGGKVPVNLSGGLLSKGHPISATGVAQICELTWQLRGEAQTPERQVPNAKVALGHVQGGFTSCTVHILTL